MTDPGIEVRTYFARGRNALVARADVSELFAAWYLHRMECGASPDAATDAFGRDALAAVTLHAAGRPHRESVAWTIHFAEPRLNVFASADNAAGTVIANLFTDNVRETESGMFYADVIEPARPQRRSVVEFDEIDALGAVEAFYLQSEQRPARFFWHGTEDLVMVSAQPDCDEQWLFELDRERILTLDRDVELALLERRRYRFACGCDQGRMLDLLVPVYRRQADELFGGEQTIRVHCPRCGVRHAITREALEAHAR